MPKIRGRFAPLFDELGNDPRWLLELNDFEKFIYQLVLCTIYWSNGTAPDDAKFYQRRYNLRARPGQVRHALDTIKLHFSKLVEKDKKLSLLNYKGYENEVVRPKSLEVDKEEEKEIERWFDQVWARYPSKDGKKEAFRHFKCSVRTELDFQRINLALDKYLKHLSLPQNSWKQPKNGKTWFNNWQDWEKWQEPKPEQPIRKPEGRDYSRDDKEFKQKLKEWQKERDQENVGAKNG